MSFDDLADGRRRDLLKALAVSGTLALPASDGRAFPTEGTAGSRHCGDPGMPAWGQGFERQRRADLGDGTYRNPVIPGDHPDATIIKDGLDYWMTFSSFDYYPAIIIWHSFDLVNWTPVGPALAENIGPTYAPSLARYKGKYFIYIPTVQIAEDASKGIGSVKLSIYVISASSMRGPWTAPVDLGLDGFFDPGHAAGSDGRRYLFLSGGHRVTLSEDGLRVTGKPEKVYSGWQYPKDWVVETYSLEGIKIIKRKDWFYIFSAVGGTAGPPTSHLVISARSRSIDGPWENCPNNPIVRTKSAAEPWWSRGHATPVEGPAGDWWLLYHGYENGHRTLGRQMLLEPMEWTADDWPRALGGELRNAVPKPASGRQVGGFPLSDDFVHDSLGVRWTSYSPSGAISERARISEGRLTLSGRGHGPADSEPFAVIAGDRKYEFSVTVQLSGAVSAGLLLFYDPKFFCGLEVAGSKIRLYQNGKRITFYPEIPTNMTDHIGLRIVNDDDVVSLFYSTDFTRWTKIDFGMEVSGYNHNTAGGFLSLRPALFSAGQGQAIFTKFRYKAR